MKKYQWVDLELRRKSNLYSIIAFLSFLAAVVCMFLAGEVIPRADVVSFVCMMAAFVFILLSYKMQADDKKLKERDER